MTDHQINELIDQWRGVPAGELRLEDYQQFQSLGSACLYQDQSHQLLDFIQDQNNQGAVGSMGCVLLGALVKKVLEKEESVENCQTAIAHLTKVCRPDELLQGLHQIIDHIDPGCIADTIVLLIPHLQTVLLRLDGGRAAAVGGALEGFHRQMARLPVPFTAEQEEDDEHGLSRCCTAITSFIRPLLEEVEELEEGKGGGAQCGSTPAEEELKLELRNFCKLSLREPLLEAGLHGDAASPLWLFAVEIMEALQTVSGPLAGLLLCSSGRTDGSLWIRESTSCVAYLLFVRHIAIDRFPAVFSPEFVLQSNVDHANHLLSSQKESHLLKALALLTESLKKVPDQSLSPTLLGLRGFHWLSQNLRLIITECPLQHLREEGLQVLQMFIHKLDDEAKHVFFRMMLKTSDQKPGITGFIVKNIRTQIQKSLKTGSGREWFQGAESVSVVRLTLCLPQGAHTDLLTSTDQIMESLKLLRFVMMRSTEMKIKAKMWAELCSLKEEYLRTLSVCINISRNYYTAHIKDLKEQHKLRAKQAREEERYKTKVSNIPEIQDKAVNTSPEAQHQVSQNALVTFDLMESLIASIKEITEEKTTRAT